MSDNDSFIEEVTEEVRKDKLFGYLKKYGWIGIVLVLGTVGTTAYLEWKKSADMAASQALGDQILAATDLPTPEARAQALATISADAGQAQVVIDLRQAAEFATAGNKQTALEILDRIGSISQNALYRDLANLKAVMLRGKDMAPEDRAKTLAGLAQPGQPFRPLAIEQQAIMAMDQGDNAKALEILRDLFLDSQATAALRSRTQQMIIALGGEVPSNPQLQFGQEPAQ